MNQGTPKLYLQPRFFIKTPEMYNYLCYISTSTANRDFKLSMTQAMHLIFSMPKSALLTAFPILVDSNAFLPGDQDKPLEPSFSFFFLLHLTSVKKPCWLNLDIQISTILHQLHSTIILVQAIIISCFQYPLSLFPFFHPLTHSIDYSHYKN